MSVILDALQKARREALRDPSAGAAGADTRALEGAHRSGEARGTARRGVLILVVLGSVLFTVAVCAGVFYFLAVRIGVIAPGWPITMVSSGQGSAATPGAQVLGSDNRVALAGTPVEVPSWDGGTPPPGGTVGAQAAGMFPGGHPVAPGAPLPTPAPISAAASGMGSAAGHPAVLPPPADLPIVVQQGPAQGLPGGSPAVSTVPAVAAAPPAATPAITVGTILCDETGCSAALNGRTVRAGDVILDYTVMSVSEDKVVVQRAGEAPLVLRPRM